MSKSKPYPGTQAVLRALLLLKTFTDDRPELGLTDLVTAVGLNKTTTYRLLTALESEDMIVRNPHTDTYQLGSGVITLGGRALRANDLRRTCRPELQKLANLGRETAALEVLSGAEIVILDEVPSDRVMSGGQAVGTRWPAHATSTGKAMLAYLPPGELTAVLPTTLTAKTSHTITNLAELQADLARIRQRGYAIADEELELGLVAVGAPLFNFDGDVIGAISLAGPKVRLSSERISLLGQLVREAARHISTLRGWQPES